MIPKRDRTKFRLEHPHYQRDAMRKYRHEKREQYLGYNKRFNKTIKARVSAIRRHTKERLLDNRFKVDSEKIRQVFLRSNGNCFYCKKRINWRSFTIDHKRSKSKGGTNHANNLVVSCKKCNERKWSLSVKEFKRRLIRWVKP
jgi:5-methylcytosine-specific restriction endonuclease McrA